MQRDPRVGISAIAPDNPYHAIMIRGASCRARVTAPTRTSMNLAKKYLGLDKYPGHKPGEVRVIYRIPTRASAR